MYVMLEQLAVNARFKGGTELCETLKNHYGIDRPYPTVQKYLRLKNKTKMLARSTHFNLSFSS